MAGSFFDKAIVGLTASNLIGDALFGKQVFNPFNPDDNIVSHLRERDMRRASKRSTSQYASPDIHNLPVIQRGTVRDYAPEYFTGEFLIPVFEDDQEFDDFIAIANRCHQLERGWAAGDDRGFPIFDDDGVPHEFGSRFHRELMAFMRHLLDSYFPPAPQAEEDIVLDDASSFIGQEYDGSFFDGDIYTTNGDGSQRLNDDVIAEMFRD